MKMGSIGLGNLSLTRSAPLGRRPVRWTVSYTGQPSSGLWEWKVSCSSDPADRRILHTSLWTTARWRGARARFCAVTYAPNRLENALTRTSCFRGSTLYQSRLRASQRSGQGRRQSIGFLADSSRLWRFPVRGFASLERQGQRTQPPEASYGASSALRGAVFSDDRNSPFWVMERLPIHVDSAVSCIQECGHRPDDRL
jgi:hypothetical protein